MSVISIQDINIVDNVVEVYAVIEDVKLRWAATYLDPEEWEPALCTASFELYDGEQLPTNESELVDYIDNLDLNWEIADNDYF